MKNDTTESFVEQLQALWSVESMLVEGLPRILKKALNLGLVKGLAHHLAETDQHKVAIEGICKQLDIVPNKGEPEQGIMLLLREGESRMMTLTGRELDLAIIDSAQQIEAYEITLYEDAVEAANARRYTGIAKRLALTMEEEKQSLTRLKFLEKTLTAERAVIGEENL
jgi:ferritin-like metal-binding protein YciE